MSDQNEVASPKDLRQSPINARSFGVPQDDVVFGVVEGELVAPVDRHGKDRYICRRDPADAQRLP